MMGSQPFSNFLGIEASCLSFSSLTCMRALVICFVKAMLIALALGLLASFCKKYDNFRNVTIIKVKNIKINNRANIRHGSNWLRNFNRQSFSVFRQFDMFSSRSRDIAYTNYFPINSRGLTNM